MNSSLLGFVILIGSLFVGRWINERALRQLDGESSRKIIVGLSRFRMVSFGGVIAIVVAYFVFGWLNPGESNKQTAFVIFAVTLIIYMIGGTAFVFFKLKRMAADEDYISSFLLSNAVQYLGLIAYFAISRGMG